MYATNSARRIALLLTTASALTAVTPAISLAQDRNAPTDSTHVSKTFFTRRDAYWTLGAIAVTGGISYYDKKVANWSQKPNIQGDQSRHDFFDAVTHVNETPLTLAALATYLTGRVGRWNTVTDVGLHMTEAMVLTDVTSEIIRGPVGRARPRVSQDDQYNFSFGKGFTVFANRAFPSLHSASAFAFASSLTAEIHERNPTAAWVVGPVLYTAALIPGGTRIYLNQHWASDVVSGAFVGTLFGAKVVHYAHTHRRTKLDRILMGTTFSMDPHGGFAVGSSFTP
jgi:membrane-associated phospholipid phosphatase